MKIYASPGSTLSGNQHSGFTLRSVYTKGWRDLSDANKAQQGVDQLVELGWLKEKHVATGGRGTFAYEINPDIAKQHVRPTF